MQLQRVQLATNEDELILGGSGPGFRDNAASLAAELKDVALILSLKPENAFGPEHINGHLSHQEKLELVYLEGSVALKGHRNKVIPSQMGRFTREFLKFGCFRQLNR